MTMKPLLHFFSEPRYIAAIALLLLGGTVDAARVSADLTNSAGAPVADAVVYAMPLATGPLPKPKNEASIEQVNKEFVPLVTVVQTGTSVSFPNRDPSRHHVYSFSPAKTFEIKLYTGVPAQPVLFDKPGEIVLGCNIHDTMLAYVYVVDTPYFAKTDKQGKLKIDGIPAGEYELMVSHYASAPVATQKIRLKANDALEVKFTLVAKPQARTPGK